MPTETISNGSDSGCSLCPTRSLCLARNLSPSDRAELSDLIRTTPPLTKGTCLYRTDDPATAWYLVRSGVIKTMRIHLDGEESVTGFFYPGELFGVEGAATGRHEETAQTLGPATVCIIDIARLPRLWQLGAGEPVLRLLGERERLDTGLRINLGQSRAEMRIAGFLRLLMRRTARQGFDPSALALPMSRTDLANHLGLTLECVSRVLSRWRRAGVIEFDRTNLRVLDQDALDATAWHLAA